MRPRIRLSVTSPLRRYVHLHRAAPRGAWRLGASPERCVPECQCSIRAALVARPPVPTTLLKTLAGLLRQRRSLASVADQSRLVVRVMGSGQPKKGKGKGGEASLYKDSVSLPQTSFDLRANSKTKEPEMQAWWAEQRIYERCVPRQLTPRRARATTRRRAAAAAPSTHFSFFSSAQPRHREHGRALGAARRPSLRQRGPPHRRVLRRLRPRALTCLTPASVPPLSRTQATL